MEFHIWKRPVDLHTCMWEKNAFPSWHGTILPSYATVAKANEAGYGNYGTNVSLKHFPPAAVNGIHLIPANEQLTAALKYSYQV